MIDNHISILGLNIRLYSLTAICVAIYAIEFGKRNILRKYPNISAEIIENLCLVMLFSGLLGARLWYIASQIPYYSQNVMEIFQVWKGGLSFQGSIAGIFIGSYFYLKKVNLKVSFLQILEEIVLLALVAQAFSRWGNFFNQEIYGFAISKQLTTTLVYSLVILQAIMLMTLVIKSKIWETIKSKREISSIEFIKISTLIIYSILLIRLFTGYGEAMVQHLFINDKYRLPLFLIEGNLNIIAYLIIINMAKKSKKFFKIGAYFLSYGIIRGSLELLRNSQDIMRIANVPVSFVISLIFIILGIIIIKKTDKDK